MSQSRSGKLSCCTGIRIPDLSACNLVTVPTTPLSSCLAHRLDVDKFSKFAENSISPYFITKRVDCLCSACLEKPINQHRTSVNCLGCILEATSPLETVSHKFWMAYLCTS